MHNSAPNEWSRISNFLGRLLFWLAFLFSFGVVGAATLSTEGVTVDYSYSDGWLIWEVRGTLPADRHTILVLEPGGELIGSWPYFTNIQEGGNIPVDCPRTLRLGVYLANDPWTLLGNVSAQLCDHPQSITVSRLPNQHSAMASVSELWSVSGAAVGREIHLDSASGCSVSINQTTRQLTILPSEGAYSFSVYSEAGGGYLQSNVATGSGSAVPFLYTFCFDISAAWADIVASIPPQGIRELPYLIKQGENILKSGIYSGSGPTEVCATSPASTPAAKLFYGTPYRYDPETGYWVRLEEGQLDWYEVATAETSSSPTGSLANAASPKPAGSAGGSVGQNSTGWNTVNSANRDDLLTKGVYAEGAAKIEDGIRSQGAAIAQAAQSLNSAADTLSSAAGEVSDAANGLTTAAEALSGALGGMGDDIARAADAAESIDAKLSDTSSADQAMEEAESASSAAQDEARSLLPAIPPPTPISKHQLAKPDFSIQLPIAFGGLIIDLDPFREDRLGPLIGWFRQALAWLAIIMWGYWVSGEMKEWVRGFSTLNQASGNAVAAGTGAQATALLNAGIITVAFSVFIAALLSYLSGDLSIASIFEAVTGGSSVLGDLGTILPGALWMLEEVFPVATLINILILRVTWRFWGAQVFGVAAAVVRFAIG